AQGTADVQRYEPELVEIETRTEAGGVLVLTDTWYPGWRATVDGEPAPVLEVDHALRGVVLPPGAHLVEFRYRPLSFLVGAWTSVATLAGLGLWAGRRALARRPGWAVETPLLEDAAV
ncbi:MAG: YfhO family protein, partial [Actinomycetota bacterium]